MVTKPANQKRSRKWTDLLQFALLLGLVVVLNLLASQFPVQLDLTEDKRYSISPATRQLLEGLEDEVFVEVYLEGEFPAGFKRLQKAIQEKLDQFRRYSGGKIEYKFTDPSAHATQKERNEVYEQLAKKGIQPTNLVAMEDDKQVEKIIFPGAVVTYNEKEEGVLLLKGNSTANSSQRLNQSVEGLEYELAAVIKRLTEKRQKKIALLEGHGELNNIEISDLALSLQRTYTVQRVRLNKVANLEGFDAIIVAKPDSVFSEPDKFKLDQFIVKGGRALFLVDPMRANLDSIGDKGTFAFPYQLNLDDLFFKYGLRLNADLVQDIYSAQIPMVTGYVGDQMQTSMVNWRFYPVINTFSKHPVSRNMDMALLHFASTIDTVKAEGIRKTPLMFTSKYSRIMPSPVRLNFNEARIEPSPEAFSKGQLPLAYLLEGRFKSLYTNRLEPGFGKGV